MLRLCRSSFSFEPVAKQPDAGLGRLELHHGNKAADFSHAPVPLTKWFNETHQLDNQAQEHVGGVLAQLHMFQVLTATPAAPSSQGCLGADVACRQRAPGPSSASGDLACEGTEEQLVEESEYDPTQESQHAAAVAAPPAVLGESLAGKAAATADARVQAVAAAPTARAVDPVPTVWPSMIPETCFDHSPLKCLPFEDSTATAVAAGTVGNGIDKQQPQREAGQPQHAAVLDAQSAASVQLTSRFAEQQQQQQLQQPHGSDLHSPATVPVNKAHQQHIEDANWMKALNTTSVQPAMDPPPLSDGPAGRSKHTGPHLHLLPVRSGSVAATAMEQQQSGTRQPLAATTAANTARPLHSTALDSGSKARSKATVLDQLAALPARRTSNDLQQPPLPLAAAAAGSADIGGLPISLSSGLQQPACIQHQVPLQQYQHYSNHQQPQQQQWHVDQQQHWQQQQQPQQHWQQQQQQQQHFWQQQQQHWQQHQPVQQWQLQIGQQQQQHQGAGGASRPSGLKPPLQQRHHQQQRVSAAALLKPRSLPSGPTAAAQAYRQKTTFKTPRPLNPSAAVGRGSAGAAVAAHGAHHTTRQAQHTTATSAEAACCEPTTAAAAGTSADPLYERMLAVAAASGDDSSVMFVTCGGKKLELSESAKAMAAELQAEAEAAAAAAMAAAGLTAPAARTGTLDTGIKQRPPAEPGVNTAAAAEAADPGGSSAAATSFSQQYAALDPAVATACARFEAQMAAEQPADGLGFVNLRGSVQMGTAAAAATAARYAELMAQAAAEEAAALGKTGGDAFMPQQPPAAAAAAAVQFGQPTDTAAAVTNSESSNDPPPAIKRGLRAAPGGFKPPRPVAQDPAMAAACPQQQCQQQQQQPVCQQQQQQGCVVPGHLSQQQQPQQRRLGLPPLHQATRAPQGYEPHLAVADVPADVNVSYGLGGSNVWCSSLGGNSDELASLEQLMEAADRYAAQQAAAKTAVAAAMADAAGNTAMPAAGKCSAAPAAAAAPAPAAAAANCAIAVPPSAGNHSLAAGRVTDQNLAASAAAQAPPSAAHVTSTSHAAVVPSISPMSSASGSTSVAGGSTLECQISDASGGTISDTLPPQEQHQEQQWPQQQQVQQRQHVQDQHGPQLQQQEEQQQHTRKEQQQQQQHHYHHHCHHQHHLHHQQQQELEAVGLAPQHWKPADTAPTPAQQQAVQTQQQPARAAASLPRRRRPTQLRRLLVRNVCDPAVVSPYAGLIWANGVGVLLSQQAAAVGEAFVERLQYLALLPRRNAAASAAAAAARKRGRDSCKVTSAAPSSNTCEQDPLAIDVLVTANGSVELLVIDRAAAAAAALAPAALTGAAVAAAQSCKISFSFTVKPAVSKRTHAAMSAGISAAQCLAAPNNSSRNIGATDQQPAGGASTEPAAKRPSLGQQAAPTSAVCQSAEPHAGIEYVAETPAAASVVLHSPSPSPARGRKLSFSAAALVTPLPAAGLRGGSSMAATPATRPPPPPAAAADCGVVPATLLAGYDCAQQQQQQQQQDHEDVVCVQSPCAVGDTVVIDDWLSLHHLHHHHNVDDVLAHELLDMDEEALPTTHNQQHHHRHQQQQQQELAAAVTDTLVLDAGYAGSQQPPGAPADQTLPVTVAAAADQVAAVNDTIPMEYDCQQQEQVTAAAAADAALAAGDSHSLKPVDSAGPGVAVRAAAVAGLQKGSGRAVAVAPEAIAAFQQQVGWQQPPQQQQQQQQPQEQLPGMQLHPNGQGDDGCVLHGKRQRMLPTSTPGSKIAHQHQSGATAAGCGNVSSHAVGGETAPAVRAALKQMGLQQQQHKQQGPAGTGQTACSSFAGLSTAGGRRVEVNPDAMAAFKQRMGEAVQQQEHTTAEMAAIVPPQQQQQHIDLVANGVHLAAAGSALLCTAGGRKVDVNPAAMAAFRQQCGLHEQQAISRAVPPPPAITGVPGLSTASGRTVVVDPAAAVAFKPQVGVATQQQQQQQQQQQLQAQPQPDTTRTVSLFTPAAGASGLSTASGRKVDVNPASMAAFRQQCGLSNALQQDMAPAPSMAAAAGLSGLSTAGGRTVQVNPEAIAAFKHRCGIADQDHQQQQQQQEATALVVPPAPAAPVFLGLSTAGGKQVNINLAAMAAFKQQCGIADQQPGQMVTTPQPAAAPVHVSTVTGLAAAGGRHVTGDHAAMAALEQEVGAGEGQQQHLAGEALEQQPPGVTPAVHTALPGLKPPPYSTRTAGKPPPGPGAAAAAASTPAGGAAAMQAPRIMSRKRHLPPQQQQQQQSGTSRGKKAFKLPVKPGSTPVGTAAAAATRRHAPSEPKEQQHQLQQQQNAAGGVPAAAARGLSIAEYFALAKVKRSSAIPAAPGSKVPVAAAGEQGQWVAFNLPVTPDAAAAFTFVPAAGQQQPQQQDMNGAAALLFQSAAGAQHSTAAAAASCFGCCDARQELLAWGADPAKASLGWVSNHYKWIVWKLAAYDRKLLAADSSGTPTAAAAGGGVRSILQHPAVCCLTVSNVLQQLQKRYTAEFVDGQRSVLKKILEQDLPAGVPVVLLVADIRTSSGSKNHHHQQQQQHSDGSKVPAAALVGDVLGIQLSDGWYHVNATVDGPLTELIVQGKIQVGCKLRVVGCDLRSDRPADPLEACKWASLRVWYNGTSPADWDHKLGPVPTGQTLRALSRVHPAGGLVPRLLLLVQRSYPLLYFCRSSRRYFTRNQYEAAHRKAERMQEQVMQAAAAAVQKAEIDQCKSWAASSTASVVEKAYAAAMLGSGDDSLSSSTSVSRGQLQLLRSQRESHMEQQRQQHMQRLLAQADSRASHPAGAAAGAAAAGAGAGGNGDMIHGWGVEPPVPVQRFRVSGVVPRGSGCVWGFGQAMVRVWRAGDVMAGLDEGLVVLATGLQAGSEGRSSMCELQWQGGDKMLELSSGRNTSWQVLGPSSSLCGQYDMEPWHSRQKVKLDALTEAHFRTEFDFVGVLLYAGEVVKGDRECHQWLFLAGDHMDSSSTTAAPTAPGSTSGLAHNHPGQQQQHPGSAGVAASPVQAPAAVPAPSILAVKLMGSQTAIDWMEPTSDSPSTDGSRHHQQQYNNNATKTPAATTSTNSVHRISSTDGRTGSRKFITARRQPQQPAREVVVSCSSLLLCSRDRVNNMWVATAHDTAVVSVLSGAAVGGRASSPVQELMAWMRQQQQMVAQLKQKMRELVQG